MVNHYVDNVQIMDVTTKCKGTPAITKSVGEVEAGSVFVGFGEAAAYCEGTKLVNIYIDGVYTGVVVMLQLCLGVMSIGIIPLDSPVSMRYVL